MEIEDILQLLREVIDKGNVSSPDEMNAFLGKMMASYNNAPSFFYVAAPRMRLEAEKVSKCIFCHKATKASRYTKVFTI